MKEEKIKIQVPIMANLTAEGKNPEYLFWVSSAGAFDDRYKKVIREFVKILTYLKVDYAVLGTEETDSGDVARRAGNEMLYQMQAMMNIEIMNGYEVKKIITCDPHDYNTFKNEYPEFGGNYEVIHHSQFLQEMIREGRINITNSGFKNKKIEIKGSEITIVKSNKEDYISITDIAKYKNPEATGLVISHWLSNRYSIEFIGLWEKMHNPDFNVTEFRNIRNESGSNGFILSSKNWINSTNAIGIISKAGRYGGTYAHKDIAFEFASWISAEFKLYLIKEFQRLKEEEQKQLGWDIRRNLTKINYRIHTDAIKENLIPKNLSKKQISFVYASEADVLNMALFGKTAKQWRDENHIEKGNIRDYANVSQLVCLANLENLNAVFINEGYEQNTRLKKLNQIAIQQMKILLQDHTVKVFNNKKGGGNK